MNQAFQYKLAPGASRILLLAAALLAWPFATSANLIGGQIDIDAELNLRFDPTDLTGVKVLNKSPNQGQVDIELLPGASPFNLELPDGFVLLDNTLKVTSNLLPGGRRIRARMDLGRYGGRANIRAQGIRVNSLRLLRANVGEGRWIRAVNTIRDKNSADIRFLTAVRADFVLGHYGVDPQKDFVWAVLDTSGDQFFAVAGLRAVPVPAALFLFLSGSGLLAVVARRRRPQAA